MQNTLLKTPPVRSKKILQSARYQECTLRIPGTCNFDPETTVAAHIRTGPKGLGQKVDDYSIAYACSDCHRWLDEGRGSVEARYAASLRGLGETLKILVMRGLIKIEGAS